jgi:hypothetical protein
MRSHRPLNRPDGDGALPRLTTAACSCQGVMIAVTVVRYATCS